MAEEKISCDVCNRPIAGCNCGKPEEAFTSPLEKVNKK